MSKFWVIALDVFKKNVKSISFLIMILIPFIALGIIYVVGIFTDGMNSADKIAVYANEPAIAQTIAAQKKMKTINLKWWILKKLEKNN